MLEEYISVFSRAAKHGMLGVDGAGAERRDGVHVDHLGEIRDERFIVDGDTLGLGDVESDLLLADSELLTSIRDLGVDQILDGKIELAEFEVAVDLDTSDLHGFVPLFCC